MGHLCIWNPLRSHGIKINFYVHVLFTIYIDNTPAYKVIRGLLLVQNLDSHMLIKS